jgi:hypothetical protein
MTNAQRLQRELRRRGGLGATRQELEAAGVTHVEIEIERLRRRGAIVSALTLTLSKQTRYVLRRDPDPEPAAEPETPTTQALFDPPAPAPRSPYDVEAA